MIRFEQTGRNPGGEKIYRLVIDDRVIREGMTLDEVIAEIHREDEENFVARHSPSKARNTSHECPRVAMAHGVREPAAERRRMARREPSQARNTSHEFPRVAMGSADE